MTSRAETANPHDQTPVRTIMRQWPDTIRLFLSHRMACVGCPVGGLHTLQDACAAHKIALAPLLAEIADVARATARAPRQG